MENPQHDITHVIHLLAQSQPSLQRATIERYFTPSASFTHPFCRTGSFEGSRWLIWCIYRWYKILSPRIEMEVDSIAYDDKNLILYVTLHQVFRIWVIPFFAAHVKLTTVLHLVQILHGQKPHYLIKSQNDLYQVNEFVKFFSLFGVASVLVLIFQFVSTVVCVLGTWVFWWVSWGEQHMVGGNKERGIKEVVNG